MLKCIQIYIYNPEKSLDPALKVADLAQIPSNQQKVFRNMPE